MINPVEFLGNVFNTEYVPDINQEIIVEYFKYGRKYKQNCWKTKSKSRKTGPAETIYRDNGRIDCESYSLDNKLHNEKGPALICYDETGELVKESFYYYNQLHRVDKPAIISYNDGLIISQQFFLHNHKI